MVLGDSTMRLRVHVYVTIKVNVCICTISDRPFKLLFAVALFYTHFNRQTMVMSDVVSMVSQSVHSECMVVLLNIF